MIAQIIKMVGPSTIAIFIVMLIVTFGNYNNIKNRLIKKIKLQMKRTKELL